MISRIFTAEDASRFAALSGDYNPMHIDPVAARRFIFGRPVAHGICATLWAIDRLLEGLHAAGTSLQLVWFQKILVNFRSPIIIGQPVELEISAAKQSSYRMTILGGGVRLATIAVTIGDVPAKAGTFAVAPVIPEKRECLNPARAELSNAMGTLPLCMEPNQVAVLFPAAARVLAPLQIATLLATTRMVGMVLPGFHSIYMSLELNSSKDDHQPFLSYRTDDFDERFSLLGVSLKSPGIEGKVTAALRPSPRQQAAYADFHELVAPDEFRGQRALIIGGSRGLGQVAVKALAAGGADVRFTYHRGRAEAQAVVDEITAAGGSAACFAYDVATDHARLASLMEDWRATSLYYFATPFVFSGVAGRFSPQLFHEFCECYVDGFIAAFGAVMETGADLKIVMLPSSSAVVELPQNMGEYAAAKSAAETICLFLASVHRHIHFHTPRFGRLPTDQTASLLPEESADAKSTILNALRECI